MIANTSFTFANFGAHGVHPFGAGQRTLIWLSQIHRVILFRILILSLALEYTFSNYVIIMLGMRH